MIKSPSIEKISAALVVFSGKVDGLKKDANNPFFHSQYVTLDNILNTIKMPLAESGLSFSQFPDGNGLTTILMHPESGEWIESTFSVPLSKQDPQGAGSALTYMRRYALSAVLGLSTEVDDDANSASTPSKAATKAKSVQDVEGEPFII